MTKLRTIFRPPQYEPSRSAESARRRQQHPALGLLFEGAQPRDAFSGVSQDVVPLSREEANDPKLDARLYERVAKGEERQVFAHHNRLIIAR